MTDKPVSPDASTDRHNGAAMELQSLTDKDRLLQAMHHISQTILSTMDREYIQDTLAEQIVQTGIFRSLMLAVVDENEQVIRVVKSMVRRPDGRIVDRSDSFNGRTYALDGDPLLAEVVRSGTMEIIEGWDDRFDADQSDADQFEDHVSYFIPVSLRGQVKAVVATGSVRAERPEVEKRIDLIQPLLNYLAIALDHAEQYWKVQEYSLQLTALNTRFEQEIMDRRRAEQETQAALSLTRAILESTADGLLVLDPTGKRIMDYNQKFVAMWKIPDELMAPHEDDQVYEYILSQLASPETFKKNVRAAYKDSETESYDVIYFKDGRVFERYIIPQRIAGKMVGRVWSFHDITARVRAEEDRNRYFNLSLDMQCIASFDGYFKRLNPVWSRALGYTVDELLTRPFVEFVHPDDRAQTIREAKQLEQGSETIAFENRYICKDGSYRWLSWNATIDKDRSLIYATARDITEQKWITAALRESEAQYRDLFENASDLIQSVKADGRLLYVNRAWRETLGYTGREAAFLFMQDVIHPDHMASYVRFFNQLKTGKNIQNIETVFITKKGLAIDVEGNISCKFDDKSTLLSTRGIFRDITHRKEIDRLKSDFISTVSHELRTPLTSIHGSLGLLSGGVVEDLSDQAKSLIDIAYNNTGRLVRLINDILDIEKIEAGHLAFDFRSIDIMSVVNLALATSQPYAAQAGVQVQLLQAAPGAMVYVDTDRLAQVLANLLSNAIKFSATDSQVEIQVTEEQGMVRVAVTDHGPGITEEFQPLVFRKFAQEDGSATRQKGGTGLGLSICKTIVDRLDGRIWFETQPGTGTTFYIELPMYQPSSNTSLASQDQTEHGHLTRRLDILHVEDNVELHTVIRTLLKNTATVSLATTLSDAKKRVQANAYDLILLDVVLPDGSGMDLLPFMPQTGKGPVPIIIFSAQDQLPGHMADGIDAILVKSRITNQGLIDTITSVIKAHHIK